MCSVTGQDSCGTKCGLFCARHNETAGVLIFQVLNAGLMQVIGGKAQDLWSWF